MTRVEDRCIWCDTEFAVEFENDEDELIFCPSCGEELPDFDSDEDLDFEDEDYD